MFISFCMEKLASVGSNFGSKAVQVSVTRSQLYIIIQLAISIWHFQIRTLLKSYLHRMRTKWSLYSIADADTREQGVWSFVDTIPKRQQTTYECGITVFMEPDCGLIKKN